MNELKNKMITGFAWQFAERALGQIITFVVSVVLARILLPFEYGLVAVVQVFITFSAIFITAGFGNALVQKKDADDLDFCTVFYVNAAVSVALYALLFAGAPWVARLYKLADITSALRIMGLCLPIYAVNTVQRAVVSKNLLFQRLFWSSLAGTLLSAVVGIWMALKGYGVWALIAQKMTDDLTDMLVLWFTVKWRPKLLFSIERMRNIFHYGWKLMLAEILNTTNIKMRAFFIGKAYSVEDLAYYDKGNQYPQLVVNNISYSLGTVLFPVMAMRQENIADVKKLTRRAILTSSFLMWPSMILLCVIAEPLVGWMLTEKWLPCVIYFRIACFSLAFMPIHTSNLQALKAVGRSDLFLVLELFKTVLSLIILFITIRWGVKAIAIGTAVASLAATFINAYPNRKIIGYAYAEQIKDIFPSMVLALFVGTVVWPLSFAGLAEIPLMLLQVSIGFATYFAIAKLFRLEALSYCTEVVRTFFANKKHGTGRQQ